MRDGTSIPPEDYRIFPSVKSPVAPHPSASVSVPDGWVLVGGGAQVEYGSGLGSMLYGSFPKENSWVAEAKDHLQPDPAQVTAFAIGLKRSFLAKIGLTVTSPLVITSAPPANHPSVTLVNQNFSFISGGARVNWAGVGNLLTASFPQDRQNWTAQGKDHLQPDPATITVWGIGLVPA